MTSFNITFVIPAKNEEKRIKYVLDCLKDCGNILILDDESTDRTVEIAKQYGAEVCAIKSAAGVTETEEIMEKVHELTKTDWIYWGFVDEILARPLVEKITELSGQDKYKAVWILRKNYNYGGVNLDNGYALRFFKKGAIDFEDNKIGRFGKIIVPKDEVFYLPKKDKYAIHHFSTYNVERFEIAHSRYSTLEAESNLALGKKFSGFKLVCRPIYYFFKYLIKGGAWRWGWRGIIIAAQYAFYFFNIYAKMWEIENKVTIESIEKQYSEMKGRLLKKYGQRENKNNAYS